MSEQQTVLQFEKDVLFRGIENDRIIVKYKEYRYVLIRKTTNEQKVLEKLLVVFGLIAREMIDIRLDVSLTIRDGSLRRYKKETAYLLFAHYPAVCYETLTTSLSPEVEQRIADLCTFCDLVNMEFSRKNVYIYKDKKVLYYNDKGFYFGDIKVHDYEQFMMHRSRDSVLRMLKIENTNLLSQRLSEIRQVVEAIVLRYTPEYFAFPNDLVIRIEDAL